MATSLDQLTVCGRNDRYGQGGNGSKVGERPRFSGGLERQEWENSWMDEVEGSLREEDS